MDDGSTDGSGTLCDTLKKEYPKLHVVHQANAGVSSARNAGLKMAFELAGNACSQSYVTFLDADDFWHPGILNDDFMGSSDADVIAFSTIDCDGKGKRFRFVPGYEKENLDVPERGTIEWICKGHLGAHLFQMGFLKAFDLRFIDGCKYNEDVIFMKQAFFCAAKMCFLPEHLYVYRRNMQSATHNDAAMRTGLFDLAEAWLSLRDWPAQFPVFSEEAKERWKAAIETLVGARTLEALTLVLGMGDCFDEILCEIRSRGLDVYLNRLTEKDLADWQKEDLKLFREAPERLYHKYRKKWIRIRAARFLMKRFPMVNAFYERKRFPVQDLTQKTSGT